MEAAERKAVRVQQIAREAWEQARSESSMVVALESYSRLLLHEVYADVDRQAKLAAINHALEEFVDLERDLGPEDTLRRLLHELRERRKLVAFVPQL